ncbi:MAG: hypothetical protein ACRD3P_17305 [Terriglobales bacterium]
MRPERIRLPRAELYEKVWATPMRTLAKEFGMSDVGLAKICRKNNIPVPPVGYWRRKETGYKVNPPRLPASKEGVEFLDIYIRERLRPEFEELTRQAAAEVAIPNELSHVLVLRSEKLLARGKLNQRGLVISRNGALAHILVSREQLPRALKVLNALLVALDERGHIASWPKKESALLAATVDGETVRFSVSEVTDSLPHVLTPAEKTRPWSAPKHDYKLTGRLQLQIDNLPLYMGPIRRTWADRKYQRVENCLGDFIVGLRVAAAAIKKNRQDTEERERRREEERKQQEEARQKADEQKRKSEFVAELIGNWEEAARHREFAKAVETQTAQSNFSDAQKNDIQQVVEWTEEYADLLDPLSDLPEAVEEFVRPESKYWWLK